MYLIKLNISLESYSKSCAVGTSIATLLRVVRFLFKHHHFSDSSLIEGMIALMSTVKKADCRSFIPFLSEKFSIIDK